MSVWRNDITHVPTESDTDLFVDVITEGPYLRGLSQVAGRTVRRWARESGYEVTSRRFSSTSATCGFTAQVHSRYEVRKVS